MTWMKIVLPDVAGFGLVMDFVRIGEWVGRDRILDRDWVCEGCNTFLDSAWRDRD